MKRDADGRLLSEGRRLLCAATKDLRTRDAAKRLGVSRVSFWALVTGVHGPKLTVAIRLRDLFGIPVDSWVIERK